MAAAVVVIRTIAAERTRAVARGLGRGSRLADRTDMDDRNRMWCVPARIRDFGPTDRIGGSQAQDDYTFRVTELTERAVASRVPGLIDEKLKVLSRRDPLTVRPGTSLQRCLEL